jgi:hypothetical protein
VKDGTGNGKQQDMRSELEARVGIEPVAAIESK